MSTLVRTTGTLGIPALPAGNVTGTVTHTSGATDVVGTTTTFTTDFNVGDWIIVGTVLRRVMGIYDNLRLEVNKAWTTTAGPVTAKILDSGELARYMEIESITGTSTVSTDTSDNVTITNGNIKTLQKPTGLSPVIIVAATAAEITYY